MTFQQELQKSQKEWLEQGIEQGKEQTTRTAVFGFYAQGLSIANIAKGLHLTIEQVEKIISSGSDDSDENNES